MRRIPGTRQTHKDQADVNFCCVKSWAELKNIENAPERLKAAEQRNYCAHCQTDCEPRGQTKSHTLSLWWLNYAVWGKRKGILKLITRTALSRSWQQIITAEPFNSRQNRKDATLIGEGLTERFQWEKPFSSKSRDFISYYIQEILYNILFLDLLSHWVGLESTRIISNFSINGGTNHYN